MVQNLYINYHNYSIPIFSIYPELRHHEIKNHSYIFNGSSFQCESFEEMLKNWKNHDISVYIDLHKQLNPINKLLKYLKTLELLGMLGVENIVFQNIGRRISTLTMRKDDVMELWNNTDTDMLS